MRCCRGWKRALFLATLLVVAVLVAPSVGQEDGDSSLTTVSTTGEESGTQDGSGLELTADESTAPEEEEEPETPSPTTTPAAEEVEQTPEPTEEVVEETDPPDDTPSPVEDTPFPETPSPVEEVAETPSPTEEVVLEEVPETPSPVVSDVIMSNTSSGDQTIYVHASYLYNSTTRHIHTTHGLRLRLPACCWQLLVVVDLCSGSTKFKLHSKS